MKERVLSLLLTLALLLTCVPLGAVPEVSAETAGVYTYTVSNGETTITDVDTSISGAVTIPSTLGGYPVTSIGRHAFRECSNLTSVTIPNSVTSIGKDAFENCLNMSSVHISDLAAWCDIDFSDPQANPLYYAHKLVLNGETVTNLVIPDTVKIKNYAFCVCDSLTSVTIPDSVTSIGDSAFTSCVSLTSVTIPDSVTYIGDFAFSSCLSLTSVTIPDSVTNIGIGAFYNCYRLVAVTISDSVTSIGEKAFSACESLIAISVSARNSSYCDVDGVLFSKDVSTLVCYPAGKMATTYTIPDSVTSVGDFAFYYCDNLTSLSIPDSVTSIGEYAFDNCRSLTSVAISDSVTSIGEYAFDWCTSLTTVTIPDSMTSIGKHVFSHCGLTTVAIPDSVTSIGNYTFADCHNLTSVTIPDSVTSIGNYVFERCTSLTDVYYIGTAEMWDAISIGSGNARFTNSIIHYNSCKHFWRDATCTSPKTCVICGKTEGEVLDHSYSSGCDTNCNDCGYERTITHDLCWYHTETMGEDAYVMICLECGENFGRGFLYLDGLYYMYTRRVAGEPHHAIFTQDVTLLGLEKCEEATWRTDEFYHSGNCKCHAILTEEELHNYDDVCDSKCNTCGKNRDIEHIYSNACDSSCNLCGATRSIKHTYTTTTTKATLSANGKTVKKCTVCGYVSSTTTIAKVKSVAFKKATTTYDGKVKKPTVVVKDSKGKTLKLGTDYTVTYPSGMKAVGTYKVTVKGKGNYSFTKTLTYKINPISVSTCKVFFKKSTTTYDGKTKKPSVVVKNANGTTLKLGTHYKVVYPSGIKKVGTYKVKVVMMGNYSGEKTLTYKINPISVSTCKIAFKKATTTYNGKVKTPAVVVKSANGTTLKLGVHYKVVYPAGMKKVGTYKVKVVMLGNYSGTKTLTYTIKKK